MTATPTSYAAAAADPLVLQRERLRLVANMGMQALLPIVVVALPLGAIFARVHPIGKVVAWVGVMILAASARGLYCMWLRRRLNELTDFTAPHRWLVILALLTGATMGSSLLVFGFDGTQEERVFLTALTLVYCAGASAASGAHPPSLIAFMIAAVPQIILFWLLRGGSEAQLLAFVLSLTAGLVALFGFQVSRMVTKSVLIRQENLGLLAQLRHERDEATNARASAEAANLAKSRFLAATSHDLRQPLDALALFGSVLRHKVSGGDVGELVDKVNISIKVLNGLFGGLLQLSRLDAGAVVAELRDASLQPIFTRLADEFTPQFEARNLRFEASPRGLWVRTDAESLERVLRNLLANALRYTTAGGARLEARPSGAKVLIDVADTGIGIAPADLPKIFDEYYQVDNPGRRREHGVGLGLAIVRRLVALLGLEIEVESTPGKGSVFRLTVPVANERLPVPAEAAEPQFLPLGLAIWVVEDDELVATAMEQTLRAWGCTAHVGRTRADLLRMREASGRPDVVILDDMLGEAESGLDLARMLEPELGNSRLMLLSGNADPDRLAEIHDAGFTLLVKPIDPPALYVRLGEIRPLRGVTRATQAAPAISG